MKSKFSDMSLLTIFLLVLIGFTAGVLSGLIGIGGGVIVVPALVFILGFSQQEAQGTSLGLLLLPIGILAVINYYNQGFIDVKVVAIMCLAFIIGGWAGSKLALQLPEVTLKRVFAIVLFYTGIKMLGWDILFFKWVKGLF
ncbi:MAG: sulfite exporter TauE/SafE family protein [Chitinophagaceae bacterium]|nr:sulfite exporter TauE/SafE family protein [Chitinophagaceae bacterium]